MRRIEVEMMKEDISNAKARVHHELDTLSDDVSISKRHNLNGKLIAFNEVLHYLNSEAVIKDD